MGKWSDKDIRLRNSIKLRISGIKTFMYPNKSSFAVHNEVERQTIDRWTNINKLRGLSIYRVKNFCKNMEISMSEFFIDSLFVEFSSKL